MANHNKDRKVGRNVKERETGWLIPDLRKAFPQKPLSQYRCLLHFSGHLFTSNNKFISLVYPFWLSLRNLTCYSPGTYSSPSELQSAPASHRKNVWKFLTLFNNQLYCRVSYSRYLLGNFAPREGKNPKPKSSGLKQLANNSATTETQAPRLCYSHCSDYRVAANPGLTSTTFWLLFEWQHNLKTFLEETANIKVV